jgi:hypothetical protein
MMLIEKDGGAPVPAKQGPQASKVFSSREKELPLQRPHSRTLSVLMPASLLTSLQAAQPGNQVGPVSELAPSMPPGTVREKGARPLPPGRGAHGRRRRPCAPLPGAR